MNRPRDGRDWYLNDLRGILLEGSKSLPTSTIMSRNDMPKAHVHGNQVTLPEELRNVLTSVADDAIEAEEVEEGVLLKRSPAARRSAGLADIRAAQSGVRYVGPTPRPSAEEDERQIADILAADKADERHQKRS